MKELKSWRQMLLLPNASATGEEGEFYEIKAEIQSRSKEKTG